MVLDDSSLGEVNEKSSLSSPGSCQLCASATDTCNHKASWRVILWLIFRRTAPFVFFGVAFMIFGIGLAQGILLPHIHSCPANSVCSAMFDPNRSNILNTLQTVMTYWIKVGVIISAYGLMKLSSYQAWFALMKHGNTIDNLNLHLGAIKGGLIDTTRLLLRRGNFITSLLILAALGIDTSINFFVGQSITRSPGTQKLRFEYPDVYQFPAVDTGSLNSDGHLFAISKVIGWAISNDTNHDGALHGSLVLPDGRTNSSVNPLPGGAFIDGAFHCTPVVRANITTADVDESTKRFTIMLEGKKYIAVSNMGLAVTETGSNGLGKNRYLWFSNTAGVLPNATKITSTYYTTLCQHQITMNFLPSNTSIPKGMQEIEAGVANVEGCTSMDMEACIADSVSKTILSWWGSLGQSFWGVSCRGGVLGPMDAQEPHDKPCNLTATLWKETAASVLDGIVQTAPKSGIADQELLARVENLDIGRWWLQALVPSFTIILYALTLAYTCYLSQGSALIKELSLEEVVDAAQTDHVRVMVQEGSLGKRLLRYDSTVGLVTRA